MTFPTYLGSCGQLSHFVEDLADALLHDDDGAEVDGRTVQTSRQHIAVHHGDHDRVLTDVSRLDGARRLRREELRQVIREVHVRRICSPCHRRCLPRECVAYPHRSRQGLGEKWQKKPLDTLDKSLDKCSKFHFHCMKQACVCVCDGIKRQLSKTANFFSFLKSPHLRLRVGGQAHPLAIGSKCPNNYESLTPCRLDGEVHYCHRRQRSAQAALVACACVEAPCLFLTCSTGSVAEVWCGRIWRRAFSSASVVPLLLSGKQDFPQPTNPYLFIWGSVFWNWNCSLASLEVFPSAP